LGLELDRQLCEAFPSGTAMEDEPNKHKDCKLASNSYVFEQKLVDGGVTVGQQTGCIAAVSDLVRSNDGNPCKSRDQRPP
jgi:hypothetical protein